ncbi:MAG: hypothetical protein VB118_09020 [Oscillospiraceae bacterium]|nr:hypothetical protein [Oscillospiraceae bacterium]
MKPDPERPRDGKWSLVGYEDFDDDVDFVGLHGAGTDNGLNFYDYKIKYAGLNQRCNGDLNGDQAKTLEKLLQGKENECDRDILEMMKVRGYLRNDGKNYLPTFPIFKNGYSAIEQSCTKETYNKKLLPLINQLEKLFGELYIVVADYVSADIPPRFADCPQVACNTFSMRGHMVKMGLESGIITMPEDIMHTTIAMACGIN